MVLGAPALSRTSSSMEVCLRCNTVSRSELGNWELGFRRFPMVCSKPMLHIASRLEIHFSPWHQSSRSLSFMQTSLLRPGIGNSGIGILDLGIRELESGIGSWEFGSSGICMLYAKHNHGKKMYSTKLLLCLIVYNVLRSVQATPKKS